MKIRNTLVLILFSISFVGCTISSNENHQTSNTSENQVDINQELSDGVVETNKGLIRGEINNDIYSYLGVPYAIAKERFVPAEEVEPWEGVKEADSYGKISYQGTVVGMRGSNGSNNDNNVQNLNIWTPGIMDGKNRPVMVWLHGGGFSTGSANETNYNGTNLSKRGDVVVVGINHRLNAFGHLDLSAYDEKYHYSANVGIMDIQMALEWIQENIEAFGGDPDNVTLFGQSGGGAKILSMMSTSYAEGLFHKAIIQSGATEIMGVSFSSKEISQRVGELTLENLGISSDHVEEIQNVGYQEILDASDKARTQTGEEYGVYLSLSSDYGIEWGPVVEGDYMSTNPVTDDGFAESGTDIPLLIGSNFSEWTHWMSMSAHNNVTDQQRDAFQKAYPNRPSSDITYVDSFIRLPMLKIMSHKADQNGADVYAYVLNYGNDPYHGAEIPYVFHNTNSKIADLMSDAWINFAKNGIPSAEDMPEWEPYTREGGTTMIIDENSELVYHHDKELMQLLEPDYEY